jgi:hypothetical protein
LRPLSASKAATAEKARRNQRFRRAERELIFLDVRRSSSFSFYDKRANVATSKGKRIRDKAKARKFIIVSVLFPTLSVILSPFAFHFALLFKNNVRYLEVVNYKRSSLSITDACFRY